METPVYIEIMSILSDVQEEIRLGLDEQTSRNLNWAKFLIMELVDPKQNISKEKLLELSEKFEGVMNDKGTHS